MTSASTPGSVAHELRESFAVGGTLEIEGRLDALDALRAGVLAEQSALEEALRADLGKSADEARITELGPVIAEIDHMRGHLRAWLKPECLHVGLTLAPASAQLLREPLGAALVIAPWNYPVNLALTPLIPAIAGGNTALLKPSEMAPATSAALARLVERHLDPARVRAVEGGVDTNTELLAEQWDVIFFTGSTAVGRVVARAAAEHLTPTILELGGTCPVFVDADADLRAVARRVMWGKLVNAGQTCIAPNHLLGTRATLSALVPHLVDAVVEMHGADPRTSPDYGRIVNDRHVERLRGLMADAPAVIGGADGIVAAERYVPPTILDRIGWDDPVMGEEIFGPILPLLEVEGPEEAAERIRAAARPLAVYLFTGNEDTRRLFAARTSSGSLVEGFTLAQLGAPDIPFGGVGDSGWGAYHGRAGLEAFTHAKPVLAKPLVPDTLRLVRPPHTAAAMAIVRRLFGL